MTGLILAADRFCASSRYALRSYFLSTESAARGDVGEGASHHYTQTPSLLATLVQRGVFARVEALAQSREFDFCLSFIQAPGDIMQSVTLGQLRSIEKTIDTTLDHGIAIRNTVKAHEGYGDDVELPVHDKIAEACLKALIPPNSDPILSEQLPGPIQEEQSGTSD